MPKHSHAGCSTRKGDGRPTWTSRSQCRPCPDQGEALRDNKVTTDFEDVAMIEGLTRCKLETVRRKFLTATNDPSTGLAAKAVATCDSSFSLDKTQR